MTLSRQRVETTTGEVQNASGMQDEVESEVAAGDASSSLEDGNIPSTSNEQSSPMVADLVPDTTEVSEGRDANEKATSSGRTTPSHIGMRSSSSKIANLRATFEQNPSTISNSIASKKRLASNEKINELGMGQKQGYESEIARLKDELEKAKDIAVALEEKVIFLEDNEGAYAASSTKQKQEHEYEVAQLRAERDKEQEIRIALKEKVAGLAENVGQTSQLQEELGRERDTRIAFEEKVTGLEDEIDDLNAVLQQRDEQWRLEFEKTRVQLMSDAENRLILLANEASSRQEEAAIAQKQLADLKQSIAASTRISTEISDTKFKEDIGLLQYEVQNWVINNFRRVKVDISPEHLCRKLDKVAEPKQLEYLKPIYERFEPSARLQIYQATFACYMMEIFDEPYLFGLQGQRDWAKRSRQAADALRVVLEPETWNRWRVMTFEALRQLTSIKEPVESATGGITELISITLQALTDAEDSEAWQSSLKPIVQRAISFAHLLRVQHAQYEFVLPESGQPFDAELMEDVADDGDDNFASIVRCATFPAITKLGDQEDVSPDSRLVIVKAKVVCFSTDLNEP